MNAFRIELGDSRQLLKSVATHSVDLLLTDPPYNIGKFSTGNIPLPGRSAMNNDVAEWDHVDFNPEEWVEEFIRVLKPTGNLFIFTSYNQLGRWYNCLDHRFDTSQFMIWHKTNPAPKIFKAGFLNSCEMVFCCWNKKHVWNFISQAEMHNFIESPICMTPERLRNPKHPAQKPVAILEKMMRIASNEGDVVLDPFMGVGSTGVAAANLSRQFIGFEIDKSYYAAAVERISAVAKPTEQLTMMPVRDRTNEKDHLSPILKWAGGKERELQHILVHAPKRYDRFFDPFVGGGSVYLAVDANAHLINDKSTELISLYRAVKDQDAAAFDAIDGINTSWKATTGFVNRHKELCEAYVSFRNSALTENELVERIYDFIDTHFEELLCAIWHTFRLAPESYRAELKRNVVQKFLRMKKIETERTIMPDADIADNVETAFMGSLYMYFRGLYNETRSANDEAVKLALFVFIRNYAYSGMFRYNAQGEFNVPYGGIGYNRKTLDKKLAYYQSEKLTEHFKKTTIECMDFLDFFAKHPPRSNDFVFLDPPYDSEFSTYAQNAFTKDDQRRLSNYLIRECKGQWMMVIKNTPFIYSLYDNQGLSICSFDKTYQVSFMNRNNRDVEHLMITNYSLSAC